MINEIREVPSSEKVVDSLVGMANKGERVRSLQNLAPLLNMAFSHLNNLDIKVDSNLEIPFSVKTKKDDPRAFPNSGGAKLPVFSMSVSIGEKFNVVEDLPDLVKAVEAQHNSKMSGYGLENSMVFIDTSKQLREYWKFIAGKLALFIQENREILNKVGSNSEDFEKGPLTMALETYQGVCIILAESFDKEDDDSELVSNIDSNPHFELGWQETEGKLVDLLERLASDDVSQNPMKSERHQDDPDKFLFRAIGIIGKRAQLEILEELNTQSRDAFLHHSQAELYRKVGLGELKPQQSDFEISLGIAEPDLTLLKTRLTENRKELSEANEDKGKMEELIEQRVSLQSRLAVALYSLVYSDEFFSYQSEAYSFSDVIERNQANCVIRGEILNQLWADYCGEQTLAVTYKKHFTSVARLADGTFLSLENPIGRISLDDERIHNVGEHKRLYQVALFAWKAEESQNDSEAERLYLEAIKLAPEDPSHKSNLANLLARNPERLDEAEGLYLVAIKLAPKNPDYKSNLASLLARNPERLDEAERLYLEAIELAPEELLYKFNLASLLAKNLERLDDSEKLFWKVIKLAPENMACKFNLANLLARNPERLDEAERLYLEAIKLDKNNAWIMTSIASFYNNNGNTEQALSYFKKVLNLMEINPNVANWLTKEVIEKKIEELEIVEYTT